MTDKQIEKIREDIKIFRSRLAGEKRRFGEYLDNGGIRYIIPELYLQLKDYKGALNYFNWFAREFSGDMAPPGFYLYWTLALVENKRYVEAVRLAYKTAFSNTYLFDLICNRAAGRIDKSELSGSERIESATEIVEHSGKFLTKAFRSWICNLSETEEFTADMNRFISLQKLIKDEPAGTLRSKLLDESSTMEKRLTERDDE